MIAGKDKCDVSAREVVENLKFLVVKIDKIEERLRFV